jgi:Domain of unknown function (DUF1918)
MSEGAIEPPAEIGDLVVIEAHHAGESRRTGEILEVLGEPGHEHYRVRWDDDRETVFYPSSDATIHRATRPRRPKGVRAPRKSGDWRQATLILVAAEDQLGGFSC